MFENLYPVFRDVLSLAEKREMLCNEAAMENTDLVYDFKRQKTTKEELAQISVDKLREYLSTLNFENIKILQTIMYMGRDEEFANIASQDERFEALYNALKWTNKEIEINQMVSKVPLGSYLKNGFKILNMNI